MAALHMAPIANSIPAAAFVPAIPCRVSPSTLLADMLDTLGTCVTEPQLRAWMSATADFRAGLPELLLQRIEHERLDREGVVSERRRQDIIAARVARMRAQTLVPDTRPPLVALIEDAAARHSMSRSAICRGAVGDPALFGDLRRGRVLREKTEARVRAYVASLDNGEDA